MATIYPLRGRARAKDLTACPGLIMCTRVKQKVADALNGLRLRYGALGIIYLALSACGDGGASPGGYTISGTVRSANNASVMVAVNGSAVPVSANKYNQTLGTLANHTRYAITVPTQPENPSLSCAVTNGTGTVSNADIDNVAVTCTTNSYTISGSVSGLSGAGLVLQTNGGDDVSVPTNGSHTFATLASGSSYAIAVQTPPSSPSQTCAITNGTGTVTNANVGNVAVSCATNSYTISGAVTDLSGSGLVLQMNGGNDVSAFASGDYTFAALPSGSTYAVTVLHQPTSPAQTCAVARGSGTVGAANVSNILVTCKPSTYVTSSQFSDKSLRGFSAPTGALSEMAATGANVARVFLTLDQRGDKYSIDASSLSELDAALTAGAQLGFKVVICFFPPDNNYFSSPTLQASIDANWQIIATRYRGNLAVAGYDLINEPISPNPGGVQAWTALASQWITAIRKIDPDHVIIFEPSPGAIPGAFTGLKPLPFANIVYSTHMYEPYQFTHQGILYVNSMGYPVTTSSIGPVNRTTVSSFLQPVRDFVTAYDLPVYVGEFGAVRWAPNDSSNTYISDLISMFEAEGYSWTYNSWRNYQGWDAELPESWFYGFPFKNAKPQGFATVWPPPDTSNTDTMAVLRYYFRRNVN